MTRFRRLAKVLSLVGLGFAVLFVTAHFLGLLPPIHPVFIKLLYAKISGAVILGLLGLGLYVRRRRRRQRTPLGRAPQPASSLVEK